MWLIFGELFYGDSQRFVNGADKSFKKNDIIELLEEKGIAIYDTAAAVRRLSGNASDKDLEIVEKTDIPSLLEQIPQCHNIVCTGQKSFSVLTEDYGVPVPAMGTYNEFSINCSPKLVELSEGLRSVKLWRMPSSSRAYPMKLEEKTTYYRKMMKTIGVI